MTCKLLHLDSSILGSNSVSRSLSAAVVDHLRAIVPTLEVAYRDLAEAPLAHLSGAHFAAMSAPKVPDDPILRAEIEVGQAVVTEFLEANIVVLGLGFYNFGIPSQLKAWIDRIVIAGKTFRYAENGSFGLINNKRIIVVIARGGFYGEGSPVAAMEHAETYLRATFSFLGVENFHVIAADGVSVGPAQRTAAIERAKRQIAELSL